MASPAYQRLTRARLPQHFSVVIREPRVSLWLGSDHLLLAEHRGFSETYKRFYFRDIQAITVQGTSRRTIWNAVLAVPLVACLIAVMISLFPQPNWAAVIVWLIFAALFLIPFVINNVRGRACICQLRTAVQTEELSSLCRVRQAGRVLEQIRPLITAAQGQLTPEEVAARMQEAVSGTSPAPEAAL